MNRDKNFKRGRDWPRASKHKTAEIAATSEAGEIPSRDLLPDDNLMYGVAPVVEALRAGRRSVERITIAENAHPARLSELFELARANRVTIERVPRERLERLTGETVNHQGVVARVAAARYKDEDVLLDELSARIGTDDPPLALALDGVEDPRNLGAIIRTAECAGAHGVFIPERRAVGLSATVAKTSAGALHHIAVARAANITRLADELKRRGVWTIGASTDGDTLYTAWDWTQPCALFLGGEGKGLRRLVREHLDVLVRIPLHGQTESLNVSVAAAVILYEAVRQRNGKKSEAGS